ncbi:MAG: hypothetical protein IT292_02800 [Deltaproteobacteria bacterium]|nr:hypothetical protein [Deltaproteobacteria bacterium]
MSVNMLVIIGLVIVLTLMGIFILTYRIGVWREVQSMATDLQAFMDDVNGRLNSIRPYIIDYFNTLHSEGDESFEMLSLTVACLNERTNTISSLLESGRYKDLKLAAQLIGEDLDLRDYARRTGIEIKGNIESPLGADKWDSAIEKSFQVVGKTVAKASATSAVYRRTKRKRTSTITALINAGIQGITIKGKPGSDTEEG